MANDESNEDAGEQGDHERILKIELSLCHHL
jgi:hypothetical protein